MNLIYNLMLSGNVDSKTLQITQCNMAIFRQASFGFKLGLYKMHIISK